MTTWNLLAAVSLCLAQFAGGNANAEPGDGYRLSGPVGPRQLGDLFRARQISRRPRPADLAEAMDKKTVEVREIGQVNEVQVENTGSEEIFIQAGDIVKGGQQDRVLSVSLLLKAAFRRRYRSLRIAWRGPLVGARQRGCAKVLRRECILPSRAAKVEMAGTARPPIDGADGADDWRAQREIWKSVSANPGQAVEQSRRPGRGAALQHQPAAVAGERRPRARAGGLCQGAAAARREGRRHRRLRFRGQRQGEQRRHLSVQRPVPEDVAEAVARQRDRGDRRTRRRSEPPPPAAVVNEFINPAIRSQTVETRAGERTRIRVNESPKVMSLEITPGRRSRRCLAAPQLHSEMSYAGRRGRTLRRKFR